MSVSLYCHDSSFELPKKYFKLALEALNLSKWTSNWIMLSKPSPFPDWTEEKALTCWFAAVRFGVHFDDNTGDLDACWLDGCSYHSEQEWFFKAIAKYVKAGSYFNLEAEVGAHFQWYFNGDCLIERDGRVVYG